MAIDWQAVLQQLGSAIGRQAVVATAWSVQKVSGGGRLLHRHRRGIAVAMICGGSGYALYRNPPLDFVRRGEVGVRSNALFGSARLFHAGPVLVVPRLHTLRRYAVQDRIYRPSASAAANGAAPFQSIEGLSLGVDITVRYALDVEHLVALTTATAGDVGTQIVEPTVQGVIYKTLTRYTVKEIYSSKREEILQSIIAELKPRLADEGVLLRSVQIGQIDLPAEYREGLDHLLAEELQSEKMRYTLQIKDQQIKQSELEAEAEKIRREKAAEAAASEQLIAARGQEEAIKHILPFKQQQIEQRKLEAEAEKLSRIKTAEGNAEARRIEAQGEADSRQKLADAEAYRLERIGQIQSAQLERDGALLSKNPLLIQKTMADKLSDKISVIIAPPAAGGFIGSTLLGQAVSAGNGRALGTAAVEDAQ